MKKVCGGGGGGGGGRGAEGIALMESLQINTGSAPGKVVHAVDLWP